MLIEAACLASPLLCAEWCLERRQNKRCLSAPELHMLKVKCSSQLLGIMLPMLLHFVLQFVVG